MIACLILAAALAASATPKDEHFTADRWGSESQDNGQNDLEIFVEYLLETYTCGQNLVRDKEDRQASDAAFLVTSMLEVRAMSEQRADLRRLGRRQSAELQRIKHALAELPFGYHRGVLQEIANYFERSESHAQLVRLCHLGSAGLLGQDPAAARAFDDDMPTSASLHPKR